MYLLINYPGSRHFRYYGPMSRKQCEQKLEELHNNSESINGYHPSQIVTNKVAEGLKFADGNFVIGFDDPMNGRIIFPRY